MLFQSLCCSKMWFPPQRSMKSHPMTHWQLTDMYFYTVCMFVLQLNRWYQGLDTIYWSIKWLLRCLIKFSLLYCQYMSATHRFSLFGFCFFLRHLPAYKPNKMIAKNGAHGSKMWFEINVPGWLRRSRESWLRICQIPTIPLITGMLYWFSPAGRSAQQPSHSHWAHQRHNILVGVSYIT